MKDPVAQASAYLNTHIPITGQMGVSVTRYDGNEVWLSAPLAPNLNHRDTAFGGSLSGVAILAGWTLVHLKLHEVNLRCRLVIQKSTMEFVEPVPGDFEAVSRIATPDDWRKFHRSLTRKGKGRITLQSAIHCDGVQAATHEGVYVAMIIPPDDDGTRDSPA